MKDYFRVSRDVRQGCPLSPYLFIIYTEIFNGIIHAKDLIQGITIYSVTIKIANYADDTVIIINGSERGIYEIIKHIFLFEKKNLG